MLYKILREEKALFHVHTFRCGHAKRVEDEVYVRAALYAGAKHLYFTDHGPFPGNPFGSRMSYEALPEYLHTLGELKKRYEGVLTIHIGLEMEYLPSYRSYYEDLLATPGMELLILGQHFSEIARGRYSFDLEGENLRKTFHHLSAVGIAEGIETGFFPVVAHPDRHFWFQDTWNASCEEAGKIITGRALKKGVILEKNLASLRDGFYREEFWPLFPREGRVVVGCDAHDPKNLLKDARLLQEGVFMESGWYKGGEENHGETKLDTES